MDSRPNPLPKPSFGDHVRVITCVTTVETGIADLIGEVYGFTTPSVTGIEVIGEGKEIFAVNIHFEELDKAYWLDPSLIEFVDHNPGIEISVQGSSKKSVRTESGEWVEKPISNTSKPWWRFW